MKTMYVCSSEFHSIVLFPQVQKKAFIENTVPLIISLKNLLEQKRSPVLKDLMAYLQVRPRHEHMHVEALCMFTRVTKGQLMCSTMTPSTKFIHRIVYIELWEKRPLQCFCKTVCMTIAFTTPAHLILLHEVVTGWPCESCLISWRRSGTQLITTMWNTGGEHVKLHDNRDANWGYSIK